VPLQTKFKGKAWVFGNDIDTDQITPGKYLAYITPEELGPHVLEGADPEFPKKVKPGDLLVAGENFGSGSSREHAPLAIKGAGIPVVLAESFARIFYRNAINIGLPALEVPDAVDDVQSGDAIEVSIEAGTIKNLRSGRSFQIKPYPPEILEIIRAGGLMNLIKQKQGVSAAAR
jgi:3-isopropylmalate/(R)-2-methylmalate dehydratase small subunit